MAGAALVVLALAVYSGVWQASFIWDDDDYVINNQTLRSAEGLRQIWFVPRSIPQYYPLVHTTFWAEYQLWGLRPAGYHVVNVLLHGVAAILLWRVLLELKVPGAPLAAAIFVVHPVMVESVAWVTERKNVLSLPLALAALWCYLRFAPPEPPPGKRSGRRDPHRTRYYAAALVLFLAALLSKTVVFSLPAVVLVIVWWKRGRIAWSDVRPLVPFFALGIAMGLVTAWLEKHHVGAAGDEWSLAPVERVLLAGRALWFYAGKLVWPWPLIFFYPRWEVDQSVAWQYLFPLAAVGVLVVLWALRQRIGRGPLAAVLVFAGVLFPALGFFDVYPFRYSFVADHFQYHASVALIALAAAILVQAADRWQPRTGATAAATGRVLVAGVLLAVLGTLAWRQTRNYADLETLYRDTVRQNPSAWFARLNLANHLAAVDRYDEAIDAAREALAHSPHVADVHNALGGHLVKFGATRGFAGGQLEEAIEHLEEAVRLKPALADARHNLGTALALVGRHDEAVVHLAHAHEQNPADLETAAALGRSLLILGRAGEAVRFFRQVLEDDPQHAAAHHGLGMVLAQQGDVAGAVRELEAALRSDPLLADAHYDLAGLLVHLSQLDRAAEHYTSCLRLRPQHIRAMNNLGVVYMRLDRTEQALEQFRAAVRLAPDYEEAQNNLRRAEQFARTPPESPAGPQSP